MKRLLWNALIINEGCQKVGSILTDNDIIKEIYWGQKALTDLPPESYDAEVRNCDGLWLLPGGIDDQVHFRDPGLTYKGDIESESKVAIAGGITSYMEMPNTIPPTISYDALMNKLQRAKDVSWANYSFFVGGTNENALDILKINPSLYPGIKLFLGSSTGNMLVDTPKTLDLFFAESPKVISIHSESEPIIRANKELFISKYGEDPPIEYHPYIRSEEACYRCTAEAIERATKYGTQLHVLHLSTAKELSLFEDKPITEKKITAEACIHHLWFTDDDYKTKGTLIKWNPAIKTAKDRDALREALSNNKIDIVATDHAPHLLSEKEGGALKAASGGPLLQYALIAMLELSKQGVLPLHQVVQLMSHNPAIRFGVKLRGFIKPGYYADLILVDPNSTTHVTRSNVLSRCGWSPFEGITFSSKILATYINGYHVYENGAFFERAAAMPLMFQ